VDRGTRHRGFGTDAIGLLAIALSALLFVRSALGVDAGNLSIEQISLLTYPEADCTKIHVYVKNAGRYPVFIESVRVGERVLDLDPARQPESDPGGLPSKTHGDLGAPRRTDGNLQWRRALPNPVPPGRVADVTVSLWGIVRDAPIRITARDGQSMECRAKETPEAIRLSQIAFDPSDPNKLYVYCENRSSADIAVDHISVNAEEVRISQSIPIRLDGQAGNSIQAGRKGCFIVRPKQKIIWGEYVGVGVFGTGGEKVMAVVRVINYFPIGAWGDDTRAEMSFDAGDFVLQEPMRSSNAATDAPLSVPLEGFSGRPFKAYCDNGNPFRVGVSWEDNARKIIRMMTVLEEQNPSIPFCTGFGLPITEAYAFFGGLPDVVLMHPYTILCRATGPEESGRLMRLVRTWTDPRPTISVPEAFRNPESIARDLTPDEVSFAVWNEIAEGAKGVRYFQRHSAPPGRGYEDIPRVEARIARDALNLQLLKPFLRIGDTSDVAASSNDKVVCKAIVCGDKGLVVIALNRDYAGKRETPSQWRRVSDVGVCVGVPTGQRVGQVFEVNQGFGGVMFTGRGGEAKFTIPSIRTTRAYLLTFQPRSGTAQASTGTRETHDITDQRGASAESVSTLVVNYVSQRLQIVAPLLDPAQQFSDASIVVIGLRLGALKKSTLLRLATIKERVADRRKEKEAGIQEALTDARDVLGQDGE
jgi:hypothetical protein